MAELWAKIVGWTKFIVVTVVVAYLGLIFYKNKDVRVEPRIDFIFLDWEHPRVLNVIGVTAVASIVGWWLLVMIVRTLRQISRSRARSRTNRIERDMAEMRAKAAMLQTKPVATPVPSPGKPGEG